MKTSIILILVLFGLQAQAFHPPLKQTLNILDDISILRDSGIYGPKYETQILDMQKLVKEQAQAKYINYGVTVRKRPLSALLFENPNKKITHLTIIIETIHGNEYLNIVDRLPRALLASEKASFQNYLNRGGAVLFVPIANPDGYIARDRYNGREDLDRDFPNPGNNYHEATQPESKSLIAWVDNYVTQNNLKVDMAMDYHCCGGGIDGDISMLLIPWAYKKGQYMSAPDASKSNDIQDFFKSIFIGHGKIGTHPDVLEIAVGTSLDYWHDKYGAISITFEGRRSLENQFLSQHVNWWNKIFDYL